MMMGKFLFKTKKLLSLLSFGVLFFVVIEIWLSHKKMDGLNPNDQKGIEKADDNNINPNTRHLPRKPRINRTGDFDNFHAADNHVNNKSKRPSNSGRAPYNNNIYNSYEDAFTEFDDNFRSRTDFKGGGAEENEGEPGANYGETDYEIPNAEKVNYEVHHNHIPCKINGDYVIHCLRDGNEVYVPFSFIKKYFEISGELVMNRKGSEELLWKHSYAKVYEMTQMEEKGARNIRIPKYRYDGVFMSFEHYRVEIRDRVKCISAKEGVPISKQWGAQGYFYPIQIAQFGLSHYSKMLIEPERKFQSLGTLASDWLSGPGTNKDGRANLNANNDSLQVDTHFNISDGLGQRYFFYLNIPKNLSGTFSSTGNGDFLSFEMKSMSNASLTVVFKTKSRDEYRIHYIAFDATLVVEGRDIYYGVGADSQWHKLTRDVRIDFQKSLPKKIRKKFSSKLFPLNLLRLELRGHGLVRNIQISDQDHLSLFYHSANWMVKNQDSKGGWPIPVSRVLVKDAMSLEPGWYSAMAQGHAMSLLSRAYSQSKNPKYLRAAYQAINPFLIPSSEGGVLAYLFGQHPWYEEYPTTPPSFVINGFMYALFGLHDLAKVLDSFGIDRKDFILEDGLPLELEDGLNLTDIPRDLESSDNFVNKHVNQLTRESESNNDVHKSSVLSEDMTINFHNTNKPFHDSQLSSKISENKSQQNELVGDTIPREKFIEINLQDPSFNDLSINNYLKPAENETVHHNHGGQIKQIRNYQLNDETVKHSLAHHSNLFSQAHSMKLRAKDVNTAKQLLETGLQTLKLALPLFDSGSGSFYDLRHFSLPGCAPNRARWDYHSTHISQLLMASSIDRDLNGKDLYQKTITRWMSYMKGKKAPHN